MIRLIRTELLKLAHHAADLRLPAIAATLTRHVHLARGLRWATQAACPDQHRGWPGHGYDGYRHSRCSWPPSWASSSASGEFRHPSGTLTYLTMPRAGPGARGQGR